MKYTVFDPITGYVCRSGNCPESVFHKQPNAGQAVIEGSGDSESDYVSRKTLNGMINYKIADRPAMGVINTGLNTAPNFPVAFSEVPEGALLIHPDGESTITGGVFDWGSVDPGTYRLTLILFPYLDEVVDVIVSA